MPPKPVKAGAPDAGHTEGRAAAGAAQWKPERQAGAGDRDRLDDLCAYEGSRNGERHPAQESRIAVICRVAAR